MSDVLGVVQCCGSMATSNSSSSQQTRSSKQQQPGTWDEPPWTVSGESSRWRWQRSAAVILSALSVDGRT